MAFLFASSRFPNRPRPRRRSRPRPLVSGLVIEKAVIDSRDLHGLLMLTRMGVACLAPSFAISAMRARECRLYLALSIMAPSVNVLRRTRRKPSTIRGAAPDVVIGQSTAAPAGARPYHSGGKRFARLSYVDAHGRAVPRRP